MIRDMHVYGFKERATSEMNHSTLTLSILLKQLRSSLEAGKEQARVWLEYVLPSTRLRLVVTLLLTLITFGATDAWAQTDYSGTYYIRSTGNNTSASNLYYLCPTENWYFYKATNSYAETDNGFPFLTTYKIKDHADYDISKAVWSIEKHPTETDCYYIKQLKTGRYMVSNGKIEGSSNANRVRVHLEAVADAAALASLDDMALFEITEDGDHLDIVPHATGGRNGDNKYLVVNNGNYDQLDAQNSKTDFVNGNYGKATGGIIGLYTHEGNAKFMLEKTVMPPTITYDEETGNATINSADGTTIRYAYDGTTPTSGSTTYSAPVSMAGHTVIKAIAVDGEGTTSSVITLTLKQYTYKIVNRAGAVAIQRTIKQVVGKGLSSYTDIPAVIRSPYLEGETVTFLSNFTDFDHLDDYKITETPSTGDIYVTYTTTHLGDKFLHLSGARPMNITINDDDDYIYDSGTAGVGTFAHATNPSEEEKATNPYFWFFSGEDPYAVEIQNVGTGNYIGYTTPSTLSLETSPTNKKFILMSGSAHGGTEYEQMELMAATGDENYYRIEHTGDDFNISTTASGSTSLQIKAYPNSATVTYKLIDQAGKILMEISSRSEAVDLPDIWKSPLVSKYNYWKVGAFDAELINSHNVYKLIADPESYRISTITEVVGNEIYVTYEVNDRVIFDISDDDKVHKEYQTYMLKFYGGESFNQENGSDGIETSVQKAEYPYSNGDAMMYVYSDARRANQFASGASTRPRWLWYAVSPKEAKVNNGVSEVPVTPGYKGDPYHVKIMSYSAEAKSKTDPDNTKHQNFFRTFVVNYGGSNHVVTGLTTKYDDVTGADPTEYMVLNAPNGRYKLVTLNEIPLDINGDGDYEDEGEGTEHRTVNAFEQYWKNNPTVQNRLGDAKVTVQESATDDIELTSGQAALLPNWHTYKTWAQAAPWVSWSEDGKTGKKYQNKHHWFQTIDMGESGEFTFEETTLEPEVILLDQHGWEVMRAPLADAAALRKYDSPMVQEYQWYPTAAKVTGYHKYKVSNPNIPVYYKNSSNKWVITGDSITFTSTTLGENPYNHFVEKGYSEQDKSVQTDFYVTYTVKPEYANLYAGAATEGAVTPSAFLIKQGDDYAKINDSNQLSPTTDDPYSLETVGEEWHWYVKPNFNIDVEMGYEYDVEEDDGNGGTYVPNKAQKDALNYEEGRNGFDPYNIQIQSVKNLNYYFKTTTTGSELNKGAWEGNSTDLSLKNMSAGRQEGVDGYDQTKLSITNATFMVVKDASNRMLLMPRFDHTKVMNSFTAPQLTAPDAANKSLELIMAPKMIHSSNEFAGMNGQYTLASDFTFEEGFVSLGSESNPFTGSIDGALHTLSGLSYFSTPLIAYADGAIIKNIILDNVTIGNAEDVPNVGTIVANATGDTRIYNCGINDGTISGTGNVGSIVGNLGGTSRVINCYSYANVSGTTNTGGIVGYNAYKSTSTDIQTMVMNCMFYGDVTGGKVSPIYGGEIIDNLRINNSAKQGLNNFNYYAYEKATSFNALKDNNSNKVYNNALAIEERFLTRFEIYRQLLNSNRKLAAYYASSSEATVNPSEMMKWVLETADRSIAEPKPYPVLKVQDKYPSIINYDIENASDSATVGRNHGGKLGKTLTVHLSGTGITTSTLTLQRTDKDYDHFNFNYDKVQLPYFNDVGTGNYTNNKVVTGWKITSMTGGTTGTYSTGDEFGDYNFADRNCTAKDIYGTSGRVFSQGAYFDVPYGVTSITIEPYWGTAAYVADEYLDYVYDTSWNGNSVTQLGKQFQTGKITINGSEQVVYTTISSALANLSGSTVYDNAIVLVGNLHQKDVPSNNNKAFTIMSVDLDHDNEPDYSYIYSHGARAKVSPIRFDFINVPGTAQAQKPKGASQLRNAAIFNTIGWFELTNTTLMYFSQIEYENNDQTLDAPMILQGGVVDQFVSTVSHSVDGNTIYIHVGGNAWFKSFTMGTHGDGSKSTPHVPVSVTGGDYDSFYLTGMYNSNADVRDDNAECYISGGRFGEVAGAGQEQIGKTGTKTNGNVRWQIYNADIREFYGGGINEAKPVQGNIQTDIFNSYVEKFCGGPKFGNMATSKTVVTNATGCTFEKYFGAGNGGNSYSRKKYYDKDGVPSESTWNTLNTYYTNDRGKFYDGINTGSSQTNGKDYGKKGYGVATDFDYEFFVWTSGTAGVRFYVNFVSFSLAQCNDVTSNLTNCTINQDFYGGGNLGSVIGTATSTLNGCTVHGNVFGGGYSAELPKIPVRDGGFTTNPNFNSNSGMFEPGVFSGTTDYQWTHVDNDPANGTVGTDGLFVKTKANLTALGQVANTDLTVTNNCKIDGGVYGGGDESAVNQNTLVKIENVKTSGDTQHAIPNVYGGGNTADVDGNTEVRIISGTINEDIYGGGRGETTKVGGDVTVNIGAKNAETSALSGSGTVTRNVYGGSALGDVNTTENKTTTVNVYGGTVNGSVFGGGLGQEAVAADPGNSIEAKPEIVALSQGNTFVNVEGGLVKTAVYGGSNINGVLEKDATVTLIGGTVGDSENQNKDVVFGGGKGAPTLVNGNVTVNVGTKSDAEPPVYTGAATVYGHVYGGGALGNTNAAKNTGADAETNPLIFFTTGENKKTTTVNLYGGTINGYAYGGGLGSAGTPAYVGGDVTVTLDGAKVQQVFGANNINGTPKGHVKVHVKRTADSAKPTVDGESNPIGREGRTTYDVQAVYGGGNQADYVPTDDAAKAEVLIEGCEKTSIDYVYGGGNAAAVPATEVTVKGSYIINKLYGGGNGSGDGNPGANVGIYKDGETPTNYGTGKAVTRLLGGYINEVYGGSNYRGDVRGGTDVRTKGKTDVVEVGCCTELNVGQIYGAGSHADVKGNVNIILECMPEDYVDAVYGGAEEATIEGNVTLTVTSGKFGRVFGGNNEGGSINGSITVNAYEDGCKPLIIGELYGGGFNAPYSIYGCTNTAGTWTANTEGTLYFDQETAERAAIQVNVVSCTSIGKVFGGGMGATAKVIGNTHVDINLLKGIVNGDIQPTIGKIGQVYGGGGLADVKGNTLVEIGTKMANEGEDIGVNITRGTYTSTSEGTYLNPVADEYIDIPEAGVYGGGYSADVDGNTTLIIGTKDQRIGEEPSITIAGNVFGGGLGKTTTVTGDVVVNIGKKTETTVDETTTYTYEGYAAITGDVYGGSAMGKVNATKSGEPASPTYTATEGKTTHVNFYGGTINGNLYGGGEGQRASAEPVVEAIAADVYGPVTVTMEKGSTTETSVNNVFGCNNFNGAPQDTVAVFINGGTVNHSVYGGGNQAEYTAPNSLKDYPAVYINNGTITENVFGGGLGLTATVTGNPHVTIGDNKEGHTVAIKKSVYGGGSLATVDGNTNIVVNGGTIGTEGQGGATFGNIYGGGFGDDDDVRIGLVKGNTNITVNGGNILHNIYGGGAYGSVGTYTYASENENAAITALAKENTGKATIRIIGGTIGTNGHENGMIFGASRGDIAAPDAIEDNMAWVYDTEVVIGTEGQGTNVSTPSIRGSVYGSGENGHTFNDASVTIHSGMVGITDTSIDGGAAYAFRGNVYGGGCGTDKYYSNPAGVENPHDGNGDSYNATAGIVGRNATITINGGHVVRNVYGAGAMGSVTEKTTVNIEGGIIGAEGSGGGYVYAAARGNEGMGDGFATVGSTALNISGGTIWESAFGGGQLGTVKGNVAVNVSGGTVKNDVYGGGALANTNTDNWNAATDNWSDASTATYYAVVKHIKVDETTVTGYYTRSGESEPYTYTITEDNIAQSNTTYYKRLDGFSNVAVNGTAKKTTLSLTGGTIGNAYGGGLGRLAQAAVPASGTPGEPGYVPAKAAETAIEAMVYGDVSVTVNGTKFTKETERVDGKAIPVTGRVFGCNNINGTPKGSVTVHVISTQRLDGGSHVKNQFEIQGVYGGGNMSHYQPKTYDVDTEYGQRTHVIIDGCANTSIERVYGGGNASDVPFTDVSIEGAFQIGYVFGGGNGGDKINKTGTWIVNPGANVTRFTNVVLHGGTIGEAFGGSDSKGTVGGSELTTAESGECALITSNIYGASKEADSDNDIILNLAKCDNSVVDKVFGGSYNANVRGNITVNIFSGIYTSVFGGNDRKGTVGGNITINIEEVETCNPIIIQNLVGGGSQADYPGRDDNGNPAKAYKGAPYERGYNDYPGSYKDFTSGNITINVKAATRIDRIFGGCDNAAATGTTTVNINMVKGRRAGTEYTLPVDYTGNAIPNIVNGRIKDEIGTIGSVYGGGNEGDVIGNSIVNIGTEKEIAFTNKTGEHSPAHLTPHGDYLYYVLGAHIYGDVFGGGNNGNVTGNTTVNICTADYSETTGFERVYIDHNSDGGGSVYGGGNAADVLGNTNVTMSGGNRTEVDGSYVFDGVYGGGLRGSVGTAADADGAIIYHTGSEAHAGCIGKIVNYKANTGKCTVVVNGGQVGPVEVALANGGMKNTGKLLGLDGPVDVGFVFGAGRGEVEDPNANKDADFHTFVKETDVTIGGTAFIMASVYGGGENGRVAGNTHVTIEGNCQIGCGEGKVEDGKPVRYTTAQWTSEDASNFTECASWDYKSPYLPYDPYAAAGDTEDGIVGTDGHTYYGNVFGGGSGYYPYQVKDITGTVTGHEWLRSAGQVYGNTVIDIIGGHILTSVYGGNETTDVGTYTRNNAGQIEHTVNTGKCTINMVGGTLGVPRTDEKAKGHPVTCYLFGAGKGDQRTHFNTWTNVQETVVNVSGTARIFGSVFGGGEDGHVLGDANVNIGGTVKIDLNGDGDTTDSGETFTADSKLKIGTTGTSYVDGNVFGGGRGFSGIALTAGSTGGNATVNIADGTMLGSIYGGGRLASVGIDFTPAEDPSYGQLVDDTDTEQHGHITINISGGTIGKTTETGTGHPVSGNVFGGSMGRITFLDGTRNPLWPKQAVVKLTEVNISGGTIYNSVYGGGELGVVRNRATVNVSNGTIHGNVFGGGYGSDEQDKATITAGGYASIPTLFYTFTPMIWTGCVSGDTFVNISGGNVKKNVYGGGNFASVGLMNFNSNKEGSVYNYITKHETPNGFGLSWPYEFQYIQHAPNDLASVGGQKVGGKATINITGGRIGNETGASYDGYGNVYGGSKGQVSFKEEDNTTPITDVNMQRYVEAFCANVREAEVNVKYGSTEDPTNISSSTNCIVGNVYGGGQDGHVYEDAKVRITNGLIGLSVYGGGEGESTFEGKLRNASTDTPDDWETVSQIHSMTAGKVYGNTSVSMSGGHVIGHIYGGGNLASVGKGNYSGGADDYYPAGYGETLTGNLWDNVSDNSKAFLNSGNVTVSIAGGSVGSLNGTAGTVYGSSDATPTGMVFGGSRGRASQDIMLDPRHEYAPDFYLGYVNNATVTIGGGHVCTTEHTEGGKTYKPGDFLSDADFTTIFGGSNANWTTGGTPHIFSQVFGGGRDGHVRNNTHVIINNGTIGQTYAESTDEYQRYHRGNVYGAGSGLGMWNGTNHGTSSGSVTNKTTVDIYGGTIYNNVYGGGAMACVGPPKMNQKEYAGSDLSKCTVNIYGGTIGDPAVYDAHKYGGTIYGGSRGDRGGDLATGESIDSYATVLWTEVNINPHPTNRTLDAVIAGNVYGGARGGQVKKDTKVNLTGGVIKHNAYGGGRGTADIAADVLGNTTVELNKDVASTAKGCSVERIFGCNDQNGSPKGHALVHVYATQKEGSAKIVPDAGKLAKFKKLSEYTSDNYTASTNSDDLKSLATAVGMTSEEITAYETAISSADNKTIAIDNYIEAIADKKYDVLAVYGGGDLAPYKPYGPQANDTEADYKASTENTEVIIDGCNLTSIKHVYGGGNAASTPATKVTINAVYEIHESFGGGNGKDDYVKDNVYYRNSGADVGYTNYHHYVKSGETGYNSEIHGTGAQGTPYVAIPNDGTNDDVVGAETAKANRTANYSYGRGVSRVEVFGGRIHRSYGGSNTKGNIRYETSSQYEDSGACLMDIDETYGGGKDARTDADIHTDMKCVDYTDELYGGSTSGDVNSDIVLNITNGTFGKVFAGNKEVGRIHGSITVNVQEMGCKPIIIGDLYAGGYKADYSIYGYTGTTHNTARSKADYDLLPSEDKAAITVRRDPHINIISATRIDNIYGGGYQARMVGNPHININMEEGTLSAKYFEPNKTSYTTEDQTESRTGSTVKWRCRVGDAVEGVGNNGILPIGTIGNVFGGGNEANIDGNTTIEIGTGKHHNDADEEVVITPSRSAAFITGRVYGGGNLGDVTGNTSIEMANGYVYDRIYGGGKDGNVGSIKTRELPEGHASHDKCIGGKPTAIETGTGICTITMSGGRVGPFSYSHLTGAEARAKVTPVAMTMPTDYGYIFGAGRGELTDPVDDPDIDFRTYVDSTRVVIKNGYVAGHEGDEEYISRPLIAGGVYGGAENGRVLHNTGVYIQGGQIGIGAGVTEAFNAGTRTSEAYAEADWIDPTTATAEQIAAKAAIMPECAAWEYGIDTNTDDKKDTWLPYDEHAGNGHYPDDDYGPASATGSDGHTFYGNVFGGGSGYFTYETSTTGVYEWLPSAGLVEGDTYVTISGGHILTNVYGGNEMTNINGNSHVTMTGGTLGVPRTLAQIAAHPVTCYLFGGGKGDQRVHFNKSTNVGNAKVNVSGGIIYGSVFGGGEDGHVMRNSYVTISDGAKIGTWGTSYVDGNVFGGGRGFGGDAYTAGNVAGTVTLNITGGTMLGSIYGGGRLASVGYGLYMKDEIETTDETGKHLMYGAVQDDGYGDWYKNSSDEYVRDAIEGFRRGHVEINISGDNTVIGNKYEYQYISPETTGAELATAKANMPYTELESNNRLKHTKGGNVFAGGMGRYTQLDGTTPISSYTAGTLTSPIEWKKLGNVKSTKLTISGNPWIMGNVYGGGEFGAVRGYHTTDKKNYATEIIFTGGTIGTEILSSGDPQKATVEWGNESSRTNVQYTFGSIYGGGMGMDDEDGVGKHGGDVESNTYISMSKPGETATLVRASVYGGGEMAIVDGNTNVDISGGEIGRNEVKALDDEDAGYVLFGGATMGNVYGGGKGLLGHTEGGQVKGNTNINISGGNVYHMVYGGGALASVGDFKLSKKEGGVYVPDYIPFAGIPYDWTPGTGTATVNITGGVIGISGRDNGLVFGSSRGNLTKPVADATSDNKLVDPYDKVAWVNNSIVNIGKPRSAFDSDGDYNTYLASNTPQIKCSVYGGGENGHNDESATVNVYNGTIGIVDDSDVWYDFGTNETVRAKAQSNRGNVYGAGSGSDYYTIVKDEKTYKRYNPKSGMVAGNTVVNIAGGHIGRSVYGGGAMASVGTITNATDTVAAAKHASEANGFALSWPYKFEFAPNTGKATVNVTGGHIGTRQLDGGDVYGSSRGEAGDRYEMAHLAYTKETEVNVTYPETIAMTSESDIQNYFTKQCITGSVHGSGENGYVYGDAKVTLNEGLIGHSLYGAGKGTGTYTAQLTKLPGSGTGTYDAKIYSLIAGKVMGNTEVIMNGGRVGRNVYGGGNMGSVGKGNYAGGADDYYPAGYGEKITGDLWTVNPAADTDAWHFQNSGKATVNVINGTVGYIDTTNPDISMKNQLPYGNVIGGSAGEAAPNVADDPTNLYLYSPAYFSGYVNETDVTIGGYKCKTAYDDYKVDDCITAAQYDALGADKTKWKLVGPTILASVYGGGQDGHVRRDTHVKVLAGEIGVPYNSTYQANLKTSDLDSPQWMHRGNIYGGGSGITKYKYDFDHDGTTSTDANGDGIIDDSEVDTGTYNSTTVKDEDYSNSSGSVTRFTNVNILGGTIHRNVYGGGSMGSVGAPKINQDYEPYKPGQANIEGKPANGPGRQSMNTVTIGGGDNVVTIGTPTGYDKTYGGEVYGACRGMSTLNPEEFANSVWTKVHIKDKATIMGNVYGGGDSGIVKKDSEVQIGDAQ